MVPDSVDLLPHMPHTTAYSDPADRLADPERSINELQAHLHHTLERAAHLRAQAEELDTLAAGLRADMELIRRCTS